MSEEAEGQEPTMEEILASIRRIISEDDEEGGEGAPTEAAAEPEALAEPEEPSSDDDVMELTDMVMEEVEPEVSAEPDPELEPEPEPEPEPEIEEAVLETAPEIDGDIQFAEPEPEPEPAPEPEPEEELAAVQEEVEDEPLDEAVADEDNLITGTAETATAAAFSALASSLVVSTGESKSLEELVSELLRPMLKAWMDENLPSLVEDMVREEIERVARRGR